MNPRLCALTLVAVFTLAGCSAPTTPQTASGPSAAAGATPTDGNAEQQLLSRLNLAGKTPQQIIEALDRDPRPRPLPLRASVRPDTLILSDGSTEATLPLTGDRSFYLSIAPYATKTHECYNHSLATCQGELVSEPVTVKITDGAGAVLVDATTTTYANGFVAFWLPRDITGTVTITADGKTGSVPIATRADSPTCLTTLKLS